MLDYAFENRTDAGAKLGRALGKYKDKGVLVLAIPRGGVEVGYQVARYLNADFSIIIARKLPYPDNPEAGFGAISEDGSTFVFEHAKTWLSEKGIEIIADEQQQEIRRRVQVLRGGRPLPDIAGKTVILVDDGIAMGSTMRAAIANCQNAKAGRIVVAAPVSGTDVANAIGVIVDEIVILEKPAFFRAVAQVYRDWYDVPDREVLDILEQWQRQR